MHELEARRHAAQATIDHWQGKTFKWGEADCARLAAFALKRLGYKPRLTAGGSYSGPVGAKTALKRAGYADLGEALDALGLPRQAPAFCLAGDIVGFRHPDQPWGLGLGVVTQHPGRVLGFYDDLICRIGPWNYQAEGAEYFAWRARPCLSSPPR